MRSPAASLLTALLATMAATVAAGAFAACAAGSTGPGSSSGAGRDAGGDGESIADDGGDGGVPVGDSLPVAAVSFFQGTTCPVGWVPFKAGDGRFLVPTVATAPGGLTSGKPLASGEDRTHTHGVAATFTLSSESYVGVAGGGNGGVTSDGTAALSTMSDPASTGLPYVQLLACRKNDPPIPPRTTPLPHGLQMFFDMAACPPGWKQTAATQGRFIVGLPQGAPQDVTFGGAALSSGDAGADTRTHAHGDTATLTTTAHGIALASGCCGGGYGSNGTYTATMDTGQGDPGLPFIEILSCEKQ